MNFDIKYKESVLLSAASMTKSEFVEHYKSLGYEESEVGSAWHTLRSSPKGQKLIDHMNNKSKTKLSDGSTLEVSSVGNTTVASVEESTPETTVNSDEVVESTAADAESTSKPVKEKAKKVEGESGPSRFEQVKSLYDAGTTSASAIAKAIGANPSYVHTILKKIKDSAK